MTDEITCTPETEADFRAKVRAEMPELPDLVRALYDRGMIAGLRGITIRTRTPQSDAARVGVTPVLSAAAETRLADLAWQRAKGGR